MELPLPSTDDDVTLYLLCSHCVEHRTALAYLDEAERERATHLHRTSDRQDFVVTRATLRRLLSAYTGVAPMAMKISVEVSGKPYLSEFPNLHFNVSHSAGLCAIAFSHVARVGVDVEQINADATLVTEICGQLAPEERSCLASYTSEERFERFFTIWTLKEAYAKARGDGLALPLESYAFTFDGNRIAFRSDHDDALAWQFRSGVAAGRWRWSLAVATLPNRLLRVRQIDVSRESWRFAQ